MHISWMSSMTEFAPITLPILEMIKPQTICEIGASSGGHSKMLADYMRTRKGRLISIDPKPQQSFIDWARQASDVVTHIANYSLAAIPTVESADLWFVDGDHNWYTVFHELMWIEIAAKKRQQPLLVFLHDVSWPCARRDMYYDPSQIPVEYLHPHSAELGITLDNPHSIEGGFRGTNWALKEGGPKNGVLTAIEDFAEQSSINYHYIHIPTVLGLGILIDENHPQAKQIVDFCMPYHNNPMLATIEQDRIKKYLAIVELNDKISKMSALLNNLSLTCGAMKAAM